MLTPEEQAKFDELAAELTQELAMADKKEKKVMALNDEISGHYHKAGELREQMAALLK